MLDGIERVIVDWFLVQRSTNFVHEVLIYSQDPAHVKVAILGYLLSSINRHEKTHQIDHYVVIIESLSLMKALFRCPPPLRGIDSLNGAH